MPLRLLFAGIMLLVAAALAVVALGVVRLATPHERQQHWEAMERAAWHFTMPTGGNATVFALDNTTGSVNATPAAVVTGNFDFFDADNVTLRAALSPLPLAGPLPAVATDEGSSTADGFLLDPAAPNGFLRSAGKVSTARQRAAPRVAGGPPRWDLALTLDGGLSVLNVLGVPLWLDSDDPPPDEVLSGRGEFDGGPWPLRHVCVVVEHWPDQPLGSRWELDARYESCFYPFTHHRYGPAPAFDERDDAVAPDVDPSRPWIPHAVTVDVRLSDDPYLPMQRGTRGSGRFVGQTRAQRLWAGGASIVIGVLVAVPAVWVALHSWVEARTRSLARAHAAAQRPKRLSRVGGSSASLSRPPRAKRTGWRSLLP